MPQLEGGREFTRLDVGSLGFDDGSDGRVGEGIEQDVAFELERLSQRERFSEGHNRGALLRQRYGPLRTAIPDHQVVTRVEQPARHRRAHLAQPQESDLRHIRYLLRSNRPLRTATTLSLADRHALATSARPQYAMRS